MVLISLIIGYVINDHTLTSRETSIFDIKTIDQRLIND